MGKPISMSNKKRLVEMFERVNKIKLDEMLDYAHVDSAEPSKDQYSIGMEVNETLENAPQYITKSVYQLKVGDEIGGGAKVISNPVAGLRTPSGKVEIGIEYPDGEKRLQTWNKRTTIKVRI